MRFEEALNVYIHQIGITAKDLADASGLSTAVISRYRSGERTPAPDGEPLLNLSKGLARLAQRKGMDGFTGDRALGDDVYLMGRGKLWYRPVCQEKTGFRHFSKRK